MDPYLSEAEISGMTRPLKQPAAQCRCLREMGIRATRRPDGSVLVMRAWLAANDESGAESKPRRKSDRKSA